MAFVPTNIYILLETDELSNIRGFIACFPHEIKNNICCMLVSLDTTNACLGNVSQNL